MTLDLEALKRDATDLAATGGTMMVTPRTMLALIARLEAKLYRDQTEARAEGFRDGIEAAAKDLHAHVVLGDGHGTACAIERHLRALTAAPEPQA